MDDIHNIIESLLFIADEPLTLDKLKSILETVETREIRTALQDLSNQYETRGGGFMLNEVAGGWQLRSRPQYNKWIKRMLQPSPQRLSKPSLETLAIVAYNQPIIRADVEHIRGVDCGGVLRQLMERKLIRVLGRKEIPGRPLIYATTKLFLELFGLKDLKDLPSPKEIEEMATVMEQANPDHMAVSDEPKIPEEFLGQGDLPEMWEQGFSADTAATPAGSLKHLRQVAAAAAMASKWESFPQSHRACLLSKTRPKIDFQPPKIESQASGTPSGSKPKIH